MTQHDAAMRRFSNAAQFENPFPVMMPPFDAAAPPEQPQQQQQQQQQPPPRQQDASIDHNHRLLSFSLPIYNFTLLDYTMRRTSLSLTAQLNGMFFLAESPWTGSPTATTATPESATAPPPPHAELTCYRRNLFQIAGSVTLPRTLRYVMTDRGDRIPIMAQELTVSATESVEGNPVKIISVPWKTPAANPAGQPEDKAEKEPPAIPLDIMAGQDMDSDYATFSIAWKRLQFRIATANNGRRKELQQHFLVRLRVIATLSTGAKAVIAESQSAPVIVRGRSPRNFQSRKDLPLSGSAAASRKNTQAAAASRVSANEATRSHQAAGSKRSKSPPATNNDPDPGPHPLQLDIEQHQQQQQQHHHEQSTSSATHLPDWTAPASAMIPPYTTAAALNGGGGLPAYAQSSPEVSRPEKRRRTNGDSGAISLSLFDEEPDVKEHPTTTSSNAAVNASTTAVAQFTNGQPDQQQQHHQQQSHSQSQSQPQQQQPLQQQHEQQADATKMPATSASPSTRQPLANAYPTNNHNLPGSGISLVTQLSQQLSPPLTSATIANPSDTADLLYEYFPLGLDDWQAPVDAVYRPHVVHHTNLLLDDPKAMAARSRSRRYFAGEAS